MHSEKAMRVWPSSWPGRSGRRWSSHEGLRYQYSSMAILLAAHVAEILSGTGILELVERSVFWPLGMRHSAIGLGQFKLDEMSPSDRARRSRSGCR